MFLGQLRDSEVERINERISQAVMETCLAMTIFREEFNAEFVAMFCALTFVKVFHWLVSDRVAYIETTPTVSRLSHLRIVSFMAILLVSSLLFSCLQQAATASALFSLLAGISKVACLYCSSSTLGGEASGRVLMLSSEMNSFYLLSTKPVLSGALQCTVCLPL